MEISKPLSDRKEIPKKLLSSVLKLLLRKDNSLNILMKFSDDS